MTASELNQLLDLRTPHEPADSLGARVDDAAARGCCLVGVRV